MKPKPTGFSKDARDKLREMLKKKKKDTLKNKVKEKLKNKKKTKSTKTGLLSKAGLMPVSTPGGIPKVISQKTAQKDPPKRRPMPGKPKDRMPLPPELLRPKNPPRKFNPMGGPKAMSPELRKKMKQAGVIMRAPGGDVKGSNKGIMDLARKLKPKGRISTTDVERARAALQKSMKEDREKLKMRLKGQKPVLDSKGKPVKNLTQKADKVKLTPAQLKKIKGLQDKFLGKMKRPRTGLKPMRPLMREAAKGMRKGFGSKSMKSAAKKMKRIM
jgi:hypothetical protein